MKSLRELGTAVQKKFLTAVPFLICIYEKGRIRKGIEKWKIVLK